MGSIIKQIVDAVVYFVSGTYKGAQAAIKTLISSPTCPLSRFLESLIPFSKIN
jgi:hypothetical protein